MKFAAILTAGTLSLAAASLQAQTNVSPDLSAGVGTFYTDRYDPTRFEVNNGVEGRNNVLQITINGKTDLVARPPAFQSTFYNTQGRKTDVNTSGSWLFRSDLFVSSNWSNPLKGGYVRSDMWATSTNDPAFTSPSAYPIIGFTNYGGNARFRGFDLTGNWIDFSNTVNFDAWNSLEMNFDAGTGTLSYFVNGALAGSVSDAVSTGVANVMYQAYNFNDPALGISDNPEYVANWSNTAVVPEPSTYALMATGLSILAAGARRRRRNVAA